MGYADRVVQTSDAHFWPLEPGWAKEADAAPGVAQVDKARQCGGE